MNFFWTWTIAGNDGQHYSSGCSILNYRNDVIEADLLAKPSRCQNDYIKLLT